MDLGGQMEVGMFLLHSQWNKEGNTSTKRAEELLKDELVPTVLLAKKLSFETK